MALERLDEARLANPGRASAYDSSHEALVRSRLLARTGDLTDALESAKRAAALAGDVYRALSIVASAETARLYARLGDHENAVRCAEQTLQRLETVDATEWGVETFDAVLEALGTAPAAAFNAARERAHRYVQSVTERIEDEDLATSFAARSDVVRLLALRAR